MSDIMDKKEKEEVILNTEESDVSIEKEFNETEQDGVYNTLDLMDDFHCGELLLDINKDSEAFEKFLNVATEDNRKTRRTKAIKKLIYIAFKNSHNRNLLDETKWKEIEQLSKKGEGYEFAYLLLHFKYYAKGNLKANKKAQEYLNDYFKISIENGSKISPIAYIQEGICIEWGVGIPQKEMSCTKALEKYNEALKRGCVYAYKHIVGLYLYGGMGFDKNKEKAKKILRRGIDHYKKMIERNDKEVKVFFSNLVNFYFQFGEQEPNDKENEMALEGKELAQYMIDNNIDGGAYMMGEYYINGEYNLTMATNYFEDALKNNYADACWILSAINSISGNSEEAYKMAQKGCSMGNSLSFNLLGQMYEKQGDMNKEKGDIINANKCYAHAWKSYKEAFYRWGIASASEYLGRLYLEKGFMPSEKDEKDAKEIIEKGAMQIMPKNIKNYLLLIQRNHGEDYSTINYEYASKNKEYLKFLRAGAFLCDSNNNNEEFKRLYMDFVSKYGDEMDLIEVFCKKLVEEDVLNDDYINFVFKHADEKTKSKLSKEIVRNSYVILDKNLFITIINYYKGKQDDSFNDWLINTMFRLFYIEHKELFNELEEVFENSDDAVLKESLRALRNKYSKFSLDGNADNNFFHLLANPDFIKYLAENQLTNDFENSPDGMPALKNIEDIEVKKSYEKFCREYALFIDSCFSDATGDVPNNDAK